MDIFIALLLVLLAWLIFEDLLAILIVAVIVALVVYIIRRSRTL